MTGIEKVRAGMAMIKEGCAETSVGHCLFCPFSPYCVTKMEVVPEDWKIEKTS